MKVENNINNNIPFKGPLDNGLTIALRTLDTNPMANAVGIDLVSMVAPRTYVDTKERNKYAGAETFFREFTGTLIVCLSASYFAKGIAKITNKIINPENNINTNSWFSNDTLAFLEEASKDTKTNKEYVENIFNSLPEKTNIEWVDEKKWTKYKWDNPKYNNIQNKIKSKEEIINNIVEIIDNKSITNRDRKQLTNIIELRLTSLLKSDTVNAKINDKTLSTSLHNLLRDIIDMGRDVLSKQNKKEFINKIYKINRVKSIGALALASTLGLTNQYINRKITEKRTGTKGFVGDVDYKNNIENKKNSNDKSASFILKKVAASIGMFLMATAVMKIKSPSDFIKKLEFTGPVTSGNAIKTVYAATLIGRFLASQNNDELRETVTRDYLGFLNWLVLGGFAAKGVANLLDTKRESLFNETKNSKKGLKHWLNDVSIKSHNEIAVQGKDFAKKNMWKRNVSQIAGLAYSTIALGILLPKLNIWITQKKSKKLDKNV